MALRSRPTAQDLRHRVSFARRQIADDDMGNQVSGPFAPVFTCRAALRPGGGSEAVVAARREGRQTLNVYVRSSEQTRSISTDWQMQVTADGVEKVYAIDAVDVVTDPRWVYLQVESGVAA